MRSRPFKEFDSVRDRLAERRLMRGSQRRRRPAPIARVDGWRLMMGTDTAHRQPWARLFRTRLRIKACINGRSEPTR